MAPVVEEKDMFSQTKKQVMARSAWVGWVRSSIDVAMGGRAAEEVFYG